MEEERIIDPAADETEVLIETSIRPRRLDEYLGQEAV